MITNWIPSADRLILPESLVDVQRIKNIRGRVDTLELEVTFPVKWKMI
jgi:hypothetical protein